MEVCCGDTKPPPQLSPVDSGDGGRMWSASNRKRKRRQNLCANTTLKRIKPKIKDIILEEFNEDEPDQWQVLNNRCCRTSSIDDDDSTGRLTTKMRIRTRSRSSFHQLSSRMRLRIRSHCNDSTKIFTALLLVAVALTITRASANQTPTSSLQGSGKFLIYTQTPLLRAS